ncbi:TMEM165/GDT1 family protein [Candidatus Cyanaurora vandensis]|uniref:TMEM165/GDT1 family protein n=1 Tax=Candidatus Cyanaurora vandensis TaxID=2714958 RepID=UPI00257F5308|nr:TMEM165/GDT1 family protein [Candidatus Cyanaurora vandensis]
MAIEAVLVSTMLVALAEMGDKTQLLAFVLASRFKKPWTVMLGILIATLLNHTLAALAGGWIQQNIPIVVMTWLLALTFIGFGFWTLVPDQYEGQPEPGKLGPLFSTIVLFFLAEIGDKTQMATLALGAKYGDILSVVAGTTLGMLIADGLAVFLGTGLERFIEFSLLRLIAAALFVLLGFATLIGYYLTHSF